MDTEIDDNQNPVQDGLQNAHNPISRDPERTEKEQVEDRAAEKAEEEAEGAAKGVNEAAGPAEDKDKEGGDDRDLTTETSPSD